MGKRVIVTGATGLIGKEVCKTLIDRGDEVIVFTRSPQSAKLKIKGAANYIEWDSYSAGGKWVKFVSQADSIIHLAGEPLLGRLWDDEYKEKILRSREEGTGNLAKALAEGETRAESFICASAIGYYGSSEYNETYTEESPPGEGFLAEVCRRWEKASALADTSEVRRVNIRVGIVLDKNEGALEKVLSSFRLYLGGTIGSGDQWISWITARDTANLFIHALDNKDIHGPLNATAPNPVRMKDFMETIGSILDRPAWLKIPDLPIEAVIGEASVPVTEGIRVLPQHTLKTGFQFEYTDFGEAIRAIIAENE
ncbi:MAG: TIGR01777 family oxidoreductase [Syntrophothermus sp.]